MVRDRIGVVNPDSLSRGNIRGNIEQSSRAMAIVDDYAAISAEVRRICAERAPQEKPVDDSGSEPAREHRMGATIAGDLLYRRLVSQPPRCRSAWLAANLGVSTLTSAQVSATPH